LPFKYRLLLIMKLAIFLTVAFTLQAVAESKAQKITLSVQNTTLRDVMKEIQKQQGYSFLFRGERIAGTRIDVQVTQVDFADAMQAILTDHGLDWSLDDGIITIMPKQPIADRNRFRVQDHILTGKV